MRRDGGLCFMRYREGDPVVPNAQRIPEPLYRPQDELPATQLDLVCMPLSGFDRTGTRLGMGGGYYDRAFPDRPLTAEQRAATPDVTHPLVRRHPGNGRLALYVGREVVKEIAGLPPEDSAAMLDMLNAHAVSEQFVYRHRWQEGDIVAWDNRNTMHQATEYDDTKYIRLMHRTTLAGERPIPALA
jgi:hypothetical protein